MVFTSLEDLARRVDDPDLDVRDGDIMVLQNAGPLAAVRDGDRIRLSIAERRIDLLVDQAEVQRRLQGFQPPPAPSRGYKALYRRTVTQAPQGCDFDFLTGSEP